MKSTIRKANIATGPSVLDAADSMQLVIQAQQAQTEQEFQIVAAVVESQYSSLLVSALETKHSQVERIESRLESAVESQSAVLQRLQGARPGVFALPSSRRKWQNDVATGNARMQQMQQRLEIVREIKEGMGLHAPKLEELASRKLRHSFPEVAQEWDASQVELRKQQNVSRSKNAAEQERERSRTHSLRIKQTHPA